MRSCGHTIRPGREFLFKSPEFLFLLSGFEAQIAQKFLVESTAKTAKSGALVAFLAAAPPIFAQSSHRSVRYRENYTF